MPYYFVVTQKTSNKILKVFYIYFFVAKKHLGDGVGDKHVTQNCVHVWGQSESYQTIHNQLILMSKVDTTKENGSDRHLRLSYMITYCVKEHVTHLGPMYTFNP